MPIFRNLLIGSADEEFVEKTTGVLNEMGIRASALSPQHLPKADDLESSIGIILDARYADEKTVLDWERHLQYLEFNFPSYLFIDRSQKEAAINCLENGAWGFHLWPHELAEPWLRRQLLNLISFYSVTRKDALQELSFTDQQTLNLKNKRGKCVEISLSLEDFVIINCFLFNNRIVSKVSLGRFLAANNFTLDSKALLGGRIKQRVQNLTGGEYTVRVVLNGTYKLEKTTLK